jgi:hypothetical protein
MGYPDDFEIPVSDTQAYRQFGNSVVVPVVETIARAVVNVMQCPAGKRPELVLQVKESATKYVIARKRRNPKQKRKG